MASRSFSNFERPPSLFSTPKRTSAHRQRGHRDRRESLHLAQRSERSKSERKIRKVYREVDDVLIFFFFDLLRSFAERKEEK